MLVITAVKPCKITVGGTVDGRPLGVLPASITV